MAEERVQRKLAAILAADVVGYSRLVREDEEGTLAAVRSDITEAFDPNVTAHNGRIFKTMGDGLLAEFGSVVDAVRCAVEVQETMADRNAARPEDRRIEFRIGVNLGDVVAEDDDLHGDGVNVAARLEGLAEPGGICISGSVFEQVRDKLEIGFEDLGDQQVKNIDRPVRTYRLLIDPDSAGKVLAIPVKDATRWKWPALAAVLTVVIFVVGLAWWQPWAPDVEPASIERMAFPLPEKPSIAVLPFDNLSGDTNQEHVADGMSEAIITALSKVPALFVIARNSSFNYKGKPVKVQRVAEELGIRYVLEGSVQRSGGRIRITAQLIDALSGRHLWSERYDREVADLFALQDEITGQIVTALQVNLTEGEMARIRLGRSGTNVQVWELWQRALAIFRRLTKEDNARARELLLQATQLDPKYPGSWILLGWTHLVDAQYGWSNSPSHSLSRSFELAQEALGQDDTSPDTYALLGTIHRIRRDHDKAVALGEKAVDLSPNHSLAIALLANTLTYSGRPKDAIALLRKAMRLSPYYPDWYLNTLGRAYRLTGRHEQAVQADKLAVQRNPHSILYRIGLIATQSAWGRDAEAQTAAAEVLRINPKISVRGWARAWPYKDASVLKRELDALRKAGIPETPPLKLPDKPSIAVLPFTNLSDDPEQDYFAEGIAVDIDTGLSKISAITVVASNAAFRFKGRTIDVRQIGQRLGARYVLQGAVRRAGDRVRINAQLIDAKSGRQLWAERYQGRLADTFALQDQVTGRIIEALSLKLAADEKARLVDHGTNNFEAHDAFLKGQGHARQYTPEGIAQAIKMFELALKLDPNYSRAREAIKKVRFIHDNSGLQ